MKKFDAHIHFLFDTDLKTSVKYFKEYFKNNDIEKASVMSCPTYANGDILQNLKALYYKNELKPNVYAFAGLYYENFNNTSNKEFYSNDFYNQVKTYIENGYDGIKILASENLLLKIHAYAGWNTSSNTIGTALCQSCLYGVTGDDVTNKIFLLHRYYEDVGYMAYARSFVTETILPPLNLHYRNAGGKTGVVSKAVETEITNYMAKNYPEIAKFVEKVNVIMPWARMFEAYVSLDIKGLN